MTSENPGPSGRGVLGRSPAFVALLVARSLSFTGDGIANVALVVLVQQREGTGRAVGLLFLMQMLPAVLAPITGVVADRFERRAVLCGCELVQGMLAVVVAIAQPELAALLAIVFVKSIAASLADTVGRASVASLVADPDLVGANSWLGSMRQLADVVGPLLGGLIVALVSLRAALLTDTLTFFVSIPLVLRLPAMAPHEDGATGEAEAGMLTSSREGLRFVAQDPVVRALAIGFFVLGLGAADDVALPFLASDLGAGPIGIGACYAAVGLGLVLTFVVLIRRSEGRASPIGFVVGCIVAAVGTVFTGLAPVLALVIGFQMVRGAGAAIVESQLQTVLQRGVPPALLGRVFANVFGSVGIAAAISVFLGGVLLDATSPRTVLIVSGVLDGVAGVATMLLLPAGSREGPVASS